MQGVVLLPSSTPCWAHARTQSNERRCEPEALRCRSEVEILLEIPLLLIYLEEEENAHPPGGCHFLSEAAIL